MLKGERVPMCPSSCTAWPQRSRPDARWPLRGDRDRARAAFVRVDVGHGSTRVFANIAEAGVGGGTQSHPPAPPAPLCRACGLAMLGEGGGWRKLCWVNNELRR